MIKLQKGNKIALIGLVIIGVFIILFAETIAAYNLENSRYYSEEQIANHIFLTNTLIISGAAMVSGSFLALILSRHNLNKTRQRSIGLIFTGIVVSVISWTDTVDVFGNNIKITTFPFSFIGYPLLGLGFGILIYSYFTSHLRMEIVQTKDDNTTVSTAKVVWKENNTKSDTPKPVEKKESVYEQLQKQHTLIEGMESETSNSQQSIRYCRYCGAKNQTDAVFCETCGKRF